MREREQVVQLLLGFLKSAKQPTKMLLENGKLQMNVDHAQISMTISNAIQRASTRTVRGAVATYIPELAKVSPDKLGMHLTSVIGEEFDFGDSEERFSTQSISKVLSLALALLEEDDEKIWERVDVEPSGPPFNSLVQLEYEHGIPRNPLINSGALVICDILVSHLKDPKKLLSGDGKKMRGVKFYAEAEVNFSALKNLVKEAILWHKRRENEEKSKK